MTKTIYRLFKPDTSKHKLENIILDLDETLISAIELNSGKSGINRYKKFSYHNFDNEYIICERPGVQQFLDFCFKHFNVSVWTAASKEYCLYVVDKVVLKNKKRRLDYILFDSHCDESYKDSKCLKHLNRLFHLDAYNRNNTVLIDDNPETFSRQKNQIIKIKSFQYYKPNSETDNELEQIMNKLKTMI